MKTHPDCLPCLLRQAEATTRLVTNDPRQHHAIMEEVATLLARIDPTLSPPENATAMYRLIAERSGVADPFATAKEESNALALRLRPAVEEQIGAAADPLLAAIRFAMAGNVIDYGAHHDFNVEETLAACQEKEPVIDDYQELRRDLATASTVLYLADNCGELVFDGLCIEQLQQDVTVAVKAGPIINDALLADAQACGLDRLCRVVTNTTACPGTPLASVSDKFRTLFDQADLVISKGQGNFETLSECRRPLYFLLTVKCAVVARHLAKYSSKPVAIGDTVLLKHQGAAA
ncbi:MAG TPA: ARMT1-like domain-containing protein [Desulfurivibrionaceae bacterium]|nr:ARMT1-like domain-containing protein [Desulfurivibrionaceae bacterium]